MYGMYSSSKHTLHTLHTIHETAFTSKIKLLLFYSRLMYSMYSLKFNTGKNKNKK